MRNGVIEEGCSALRRWAERVGSRQLAVGRGWSRSKCFFIASLLTDGHRERSSDLDLDARPVKHTRPGRFTNLSDTTCVAVHDQRGRARLGGLVHAGLCETGSDFDRGRLLAPPFGEAKGGSVPVVDEVEPV